jgi:uncharacterized tellurite resistance protein B-like protein
MLERLFGVFGGAKRESSPADAPADLHRAAAVLLVVAAGIDGHFAAEEREAIREVLQARFDLPPATVHALIEEAAAVADASADLFSFTREVNKYVKFDDRVTIIEMLWQVAYADGTLHDYEANLVRRVCGLLHVADQDSGAARRRVLRRLEDGS